MSPTLSVVIPTYNRRDRLARVLASLAVQEVDVPFEVIVVSDGSSDGTDEYLAGDDVPLPAVHVTQANAGPAAARNRGVEAAKGEFVVFIDDDVVAEPGLLDAHLSAHRQLGPHVVVIGPMLTPADHQMSPWVAWEQTMLDRQYEAMRRGRYRATARQFYTGNASLRTEHLRRVGGFDERFRRAEDVELAYRLDDIDLAFHFVPAAVGRHYAERSYAAWRDAAYAYGRNDVVFARDLDRPWLFGFLRRSFRKRNLGLRWLTMRCVESSTWRTKSIRSFERINSFECGAWSSIVQQYALSSVFSIEYHCGVADELGSPSAFRRVIRLGSRAMQPVGSDDD